MASGQSVLVIDGQKETEEVLKAVLEPRGLKVDRIQGSQPGTAAEDRPTPDVIIIHTNDDDTTIQQKSNWTSVPRVIIGTAQIPVQQSEASPNGDRYLPKPFQYGELINAIERLLDEQTASNIPS